MRCVDYWLWGLSVGLTEDPVRCARIVERLTSTVSEQVKLRPAWPLPQRANPATSSWLRHAERPAGRERQRCGRGGALVAYPPEVEGCGGRFKEHSSICHHPRPRASRRRWRRLVRCRRLHRRRSIFGQGLRRGRWRCLTTSVGVSVGKIGTGVSVGSAGTVGGTACPSAAAQVYLSAAQACRSAATARR